MGKFKVVRRSAEGHLKASRGHPGTCWNWTGHINDSGYGLAIYLIGRDQIKERAHRFSYERIVGPIPDGLTIDHLCRNTRCINPSHLEPVTMGVNVLRGNSLPAIHARKTHCDRGHPLSGDNLSIITRKNRPGEKERRCRKCHVLRNGIARDRKNGLKQI